MSLLVKHLNATDYKGSYVIYDGEHKSYSDLCYLVSKLNIFSNSDLNFDRFAIKSES